MTAEKSMMRDATFMIQRPATVLKVSGGDAFTFLQGQFTNDLRNKGPRPATYGLWLNSKGKVQADSFVLQRSTDDLLLVSLTSDAATIRTRLEAYIIADDVTLEDETATSAVVLFSGAEADAMWDGAPPVGEYVERSGGLVFRGREGASMWFGPVAAADVLAAKLSEAGFSKADPREFERRRILGGIPVIPADIGPADLPQEGGLDHSAVSFNKGCYLGQEVMARLHAMGQVRRTLVVVEGTGAAPTEAAQVFAAGKSVGELRSRCALDDGRFFALAMVQRAALAAGAALSLNSDGSQPLRVLQETPSHD